MDQKINKCGACNNLYIGQPCPYCQLAAAEKRAERAETYESDAILFRAERDAAIKRAETAERRLDDAYRRVDELRKAEADRDRLRDAIKSVEDWMHDDRAGMSALAAIIQDATGEAAIADEHHHGGLPDIMSVAEARRREAGKAEPDVQP